MTSFGKPARGFVLGKFMPPHKGHMFLCEFGRTYVENLTILVCTLPWDVIPGQLRFDWMKELFPNCRVLWCPEVLPQRPEDNPDQFWPIWRDVVARYHPEPLDVVFASETYGHRLAEKTGARFVPCDIARSARSCSATDIRADPFAHWDFIPDPVKPYYVARICLFGPESSGKTTLAGQLGQHFRTIVVPEYGRTYTNAFGTAVDANDLRRIAAGQIASTHAAKRQANRLIIEDTDPVMTAVWSDMLLGAREPWLAEYEDHADLYLLCDVDFPWEDDGTRYFSSGDDRRWFFELCEAELRHRAVNYVTLSGPIEVRFHAAVSAVEKMIASNRFRNADRVSFSSET